MQETKYYCDVCKLETTGDAKIDVFYFGRFSKRSENTEIHLCIEHHAEFTKKYFNDV